jgi:tRNA dimethylallyltransferase
VLDPDRDALRAAIDTRFKAMVEAGALDEVRALMARTLPPDRPVMKAVGVPELSAHLRGEIDLATAITRAQAASRQYAKRQRTWLRHRMRADLTLSPPQIAQQPETLAAQTTTFVRGFLLTG